MEDFEKLKEELNSLRTENDALKDEIERLKNGNGFDAESYIKRLQEQAQRDKAAEEALKARFL